MPPKHSGNGKAKAGRIVKLRSESPPLDDNSLRARKRAMDREAQRSFRAKTKSYIAHLEQTVKACQANSESQRVAQLLAENEGLYNTLKRMRTILNDIFTAIQPELLRQNQSTIGNEEAGDPMESESAQLQTTTSATVVKQQPQLARLLPRPTEPSMLSDVSTNQPVPDATSDVAFDNLLNSIPAGMPATSLFNQGNPAGQDWMAGDYTWGRIPQEQPAQNKLVMPPNEGQALTDRQDSNEQNNREPRLALPRKPSAFCFWAHANFIYSQVLTITPAQASTVIDSDRNLLFKAIKCGWQSLEYECDNNIVLRILKCYDNLVANVFDPIDRLAIAYKNYAFIQYLLNNDFVDLIRVPEWQRPSVQSATTGTYPVLVDFFPWPGLREKIINGKLQMDHSSFGRCFLSNFRFAWPFSLEDSYQYFAPQDVYLPTPLFESYHQDLRFWTMGESFFWQFPQLVEDIGIYSG